MVLRPSRPQSRAEQVAARDAASQDAFLREVDDALREDEFLGLVKRHGKTVGAVAAAGLLGLAGWLWWQNDREARHDARAEQFVMALDRVDAGELSEAAQKLAPLAAEGGDASQAAALVLQADLAIKQGHKDEAARLFAAVVADASSPAPYRDLANIREVALRFDAMKPAEVIARLSPLAVPGNAWFGSAAELVGMAYLAQGDKARAGALFVAVAKDKQTPDSLRARARQMAGLLGFDSIDDIAQSENAAAQ